MILISSENPMAKHSQSTFPLYTAPKAVHNTNSFRYYKSVFTNFDENSEMNDDLWQKRTKKNNEKKIMEFEIQSQNFDCVHTPYTISTFNVSQKLV